LSQATPPTRIFRRNEIFPQSEPAEKKEKLMPKDGKTYVGGASLGSNSFE
tara:strand:+ start:259 stop:408 length:150 start_codon:yes stop_codon:yes gene_type:complete